MSTKKEPKELAKQFYTVMYRMRRFEEEVFEFYKRGLMPGLAHLYLGEEAVAAGACVALREDDYIGSTHRGHGHLVARGADLDRMMAEILGKKTGYSKGKGGSMHIMAMDKGILGANGIVGGGIPIIRPINQCLAANNIDEILGILNGTTNFIMTKMIKESMSFDDALALAQQLGYAEKDPTADVDGHDACRKICILASIAFGKHVYPAQVHTEGISKITLMDVAYAADYNSVIKLIGKVAMKENGKLYCLVAPMLVSRESQLSSVDDVFNAIMVRGNATGDVMFYGKGAGKLPTASAVMADIIDCFKHIKARKNVFWEDGDPDYVDDYDLGEVSLYIRGKAADTERAKKDIEKAFGKVKYLSCKDAPEHDIAFVTEKKVERELKEKLKSLSLELEPLNVLRICE